MTLKVDIKSNEAEVFGAIADALKSLIEPAELTRELSVNLLPVMKVRIHEDGLAADGSLIGDYSKKPIYISAKSNPGRSFAPNTGKILRSGKKSHTFKSGDKKGQEHASKFFEEGYEEFKIEIGRNELGSVNLSLSGQLNSQFTVIAADNGSYGLGWADDEKLKRANALEKKYGKRIWALTSDEEESISKLADILINEKIDNALR